MIEYPSSNPYQQGAQAAAAEPLARYTAKTFLWMFLGLAITFGTAVFLGQTGLIVRMLMRMPSAIYILPIAQIAVVLILSLALKKLSPGAATALFLLYALLTGVTFSTLLLVFEAYSAMLVFGVTAVVFAIMAVWGFVTKQDLSSWRKVLFFALIGLVLVSLLGLFINLSGLEKIICYVGVIVFLGYTAYDTQKIKVYYYSFQGDAALLKKASIISALGLYLDFINLFLYLLRLFGRRSN